MDMARSLTTLECVVWLVYTHATMTLALPPNPAICPLCGQGNQCAMEVEQATGVQQPACWCTRATFSQALLDTVPLAARDNACICARCASKALG